MDLTEAEDIKKRWQECTEDPLDFTFPGCLAPGEQSYHHDYLGHEELFCTVLLCILATSS